MSDQFVVRATPLAGLKLIERQRIADQRGFFSRFYCGAGLAEAGFGAPIVQINHTYTRRRGAIRGLHFQRPPHAEDKYVSVLRGAVFDVGVDLRRRSPTFLQWYGATLSADNGQSLFIPKGFAHGFQTLADDCELLYLHTAAYDSAAEGAINALDPRIAVDWPLEPTEMSEKDRNQAMLDDNLSGIPS